MFGIHPNLDSYKKKDLKSWLRFHLSPKSHTVSASSHYFCLLHTVIKLPHSALVTAHHQSITNLNIQIESCGCSQIWNCTGRMRSVSSKDSIKNEESKEKLLLPIFLYKHSKTFILLNFNSGYPSHSVLPLL